jgi:hypothetical protein
MTLIWEQEAAGSSPTIPTPFFECVVSLWKQARLVDGCRLMQAAVAD